MQWSYLESFQDSPSPYLKKQSVTNPTQQKVCTALGEKYNPSTNECIDCEVGTYQDATNHTLTSCKAHVEPICDTGFYSDTAEYTKRKNATKDSPVNLDGLCLEHDSLEDLREQCSDLEYITESDYNEKINTMKKTPLTSTQVCKKHTSWDNIKSIGSCNEKNYFDRTKYNNSVGNKERNVSLEDICSTIPYYPLNVKNADEKNFTTKENLNMFFREDGKYLNIRDYNGLYQALRPSDNAIKIPITWNNNTKKIQIKSKGELKVPKVIYENQRKCVLPKLCFTSTVPKFIWATISTTFYAKVVNKQVRFVKQKNELPVTIKDGKLFVEGTNIEIVVNNCDDDQYMDQQTNTCKDKVHNCPSGQYSTRFGSSGTRNDPICLTKSCYSSKYRDPSKPYKNVPASKTTNDANCIPKINTCEAGTYRSRWGNSDTENDPVCRKCSMGRYQNLTGQSSCESCGIGTYQNSTGQSRCESCGIGTYQNSTGQSRCESCGTGTYQNLTGQSRCESCGTGTYQNLTGQSSCKSCPGGTYQLHSRKTSINDCKKTFHIDHIDGSRVGFRINGKVLSEFEIKTKKQSGKYWIRIYPKGSNVTKHESKWRFSNISGDDYASQSHTIVKHDTNNEIFYIMARHSYKAPHWYVLTVENNSLVWKDADWWKNNNRACMFHFKYITHDDNMTHGTVQALAAHRVNNTTYNVTYNDNYYGRHGNFIGYPV